MLRDGWKSEGRELMSASVDLYNSSYGNRGADVYREIRTETYGKDYGQTSWMKAKEFDEIPRRK